MLNFAPWITNWLTPLWLVSLGVLFGFVLLCVIWGLATLFAFIPGVSRLSAREGRGRVVFLLAAVLSVVFALSSIVPGWSEWQAAGNNALLENLGVSLAVAIGLGTIAAMAIVHLTSRRAVSEVGGAVREGALWPLFIIGMCLSTFAVLGTLIAARPTEIFESISRLPFVGQQEYSFTIPAADFDALGNAQDPPQNPIAISFRGTEIRKLVFTSTESLTIDTESAGGLDLDPAFRVSDDEPLQWLRSGDSLEPFSAETEYTQLYVRNYGAEDAQLSVLLNTAPTYPEVATVIVTGLSVAIVFLIYLLQRAALPRLSAVALSTFKSETAQPLFAIMLTLGITALVIFVWIPYNTFGEDIKMLKDSGMTLIMVLCIIQAVWAAGTSVSDEIDGRTALTVLSKPIGRRSFIIGKYFGIGWTVAVMFIVLGLVLLVVVAYKPIYDARESADVDPTWQLCHYEMIAVVPGLVLAFMETLVLSALSVAISTRLPMLGNFVICFTIYVLGHLTPLLVQTTDTAFEPVAFVASFLATVLPILDHFNIQAAVAAGIDVPPDYLGWSLVYCLIYGVIALLLALVLFEDRDLA